MRLTAFFKLYKICTLLHRCNLKILAKNRFEKSAFFVKILQNICIFFNVAKSDKICKFAKFQTIKLDKLVDFEKCCTKTRIYLQRSAPIQPRTSEILPKICQKLATTRRAGASFAAASGSWIGDCFCATSGCVQTPSAQSWHNYF